MHFIWRDAMLVTMTRNDYGLIENGAVVVENGWIKWVGPAAALPEQYTENSVQFLMSGLCITPSLIDCHTHLVYAGNRAEEFEAKLQGASYESLHQNKSGIYHTVAEVREASYDALFAQSAKRLKQFIKEGVTAIEIKSGYGLDLINERKILQVAKNLAEHFQIDVQKTFLGAHALPPEYTSNKDYMDYLVSDMLPTLHHENLIDAIDGFCDKIAFSAQDLAPMFEWAYANNIPIKLHVDQLSQTQGIQLAAKYNALSVDHLEYLDENGIKILKEKDTVAVLLPGAYYYSQAQRKPPVELLRKHNIKMAVSTDCNPGTSPTTSILNILNMACLLFKLTPLEALQGVTVHAAKAMDLANRMGQLQAGLQADFVIWDIDHPRALCASMNDNRCVQVIKKGIPIYDRGITF